MVLLPYLCGVKDRDKNDIIVISLTFYMVYCGYLTINNASVPLFESNKDRR